MSIETRRVCVLAMSRLTAATVELVRDTPSAALPFMAAMMGTDMLQAYAHVNRPDGCPDDLWAVLAWARKQPPAPAPSGQPWAPGGWDYVIFDRDMDPLEDGCDLTYDAVAVTVAAPVFDRKAVRLGDFLYVDERLMGEDNNCEETYVEVGEIWKVEHVGQAGPSSFVAVHPCGVSASYDNGDPDPLPLRRVDGTVYACNVRTRADLTATRYIRADSVEAAEWSAVGMAKQEGFVWDRSEPGRPEFEGLA